MVLEFKADFPDGWTAPKSDVKRQAQKELCRDIAQFANTFGGCIIYGRSDATLNRGGVRMGTSEFYRAVEAFAEVGDSLVVDTGRLGAEGRLILFVLPAEGAELDDDLRNRIRAALRAQLSPRHVPDEIHQVPGIPRTLSGKKLEVPVRKILHGTDPERAADPNALADPDVLRYFGRFRGAEPAG